MHKPRGSSSSDSGWFVQQALVWEATDPLSWLPWCSQGVGLLPCREVFFICSSACVQGSLGHSGLVCFSCL